MADRIVTDREAAVASKVSRPPRHLSGDDDRPAKQAKSEKQTEFLDD